MSPLSGGVLAGATVVSSPALWSSLVEGTMPLDVGLTRYLIAVALSWGLLSLVAELAFPAPGSVKVPPAEPAGTSDAAPTEAASRDRNEAA
ncbi:MAG: hypothetical protein JWQ74_511 [Marmoricola sp.]|nr:hypothetical protein [Marmoricola sp.]